MTRDQIVAQVVSCGLIPCWRCDDTDGIVDCTQAMGDAGVTNVELTLTMPGALRLIERAATALPATVVVGAGTVLDAESARLAILAGARYVVSPCLVPEVVATCHRYGVAAVQGAATPTEMMTATALGVDLIKSYPAGLGGPPQVAEARSVFAGARIVVAGGFVLRDIPGYLTAGADAVVIGMPHIARTAYAERRFDAVAAMARRLLELVREGRDPAAQVRFAADAAARYIDLERGQVARAAR